MNTITNIYHIGVIMSREIMLAILEDELTSDENKPIQPLTETPAKVYKPKNLTDAEDEIQEKDTEEENKDSEYREEHNKDEEEEDVGLENPDEALDSLDNPETSDEDADAKFMRLTIYQLLSTRFLRLEYGTPSGSDSSFCPTCGTEDAADAAIIDNEISGAERTEPFGEIDNSGGGFGDSFGDTGSGEEGGEDDFGMDFSFYYKQRTALEHYLAGNENFVKTIGGVADAIGSVLKTVFHIAKWVAQRAVTVTRFVLRVAEHNAVKVKYMSKFYQFKFSKLMNLADDSVLDRLKITAWKANDWTRIKQACIPIYELCTNIDDQLEVKAGGFKNIKAQYDKLFGKLNITITENESKNTTHALFKLRTGGTLDELGYGKDTIVSMFRQLEELGEIVGMEAMAKINVALKKASVYVKKEAIRIKALKESNINNDKLKKELDLLQAYNLRYSYLANCAHTYTLITDRLVSDLYEVSKTFESAMVPKQLRSGSGNEDTDND